MSNIPKNMDEIDIKRSLANEGIHVLGVTIERDNIVEQKSGKGELKLRVPKSQERRIKKKVEGMGIRALVKKFKNAPK